MTVWAILPLVKFNVNFFGNYFLNAYFVRNKGSGKINVMNLQYDLVENGFEEYAKWKPD